VPHFAPPATGCAVLIAGATVRASALRLRNKQHRLLNRSCNAASTLLHTDANLVLLDVVVTDRGNPVHGLDRSRFHVLEDGHEQPIASFDEHRPRPQRTGRRFSVLRSRPAAAYLHQPSRLSCRLGRQRPAPRRLNTPMANQMDVRRR
jgi:hypothetical protein